MDFSDCQTLNSSVRSQYFAYTGLLIAVAMIATWATSLIYLLSLPLSYLPWYVIILAMLWQMFLYTGLFITAHDAIHGVVFPQNSRINNGVGAIAAWLYALFSYPQLAKKHWQHHHFPASDRDPDFHDGTHTGFWSWYLYFTKNYWSWWRLAGLAVIFTTLHFCFHIHLANLFLFWALPPILSSMQLFYFGSYWPHSQPQEGYRDRHRARTQNLPVILSFFTCYHFGYHHEHHAYPHLAWWELPKAHKQELQMAQAIVARK